MEYCTPDDIRRLTNISLKYIDDPTLKELIAIAQRRCDTRLSHAGIPLPIETPNDRLRDAAAYTTASLLTARRSADMTRPASQTVQDSTYTVTVTEEIKYFDSLAADALNEYIRARLSEEKKQAGTVMYIVEGE